MRAIRLDLGFLRGQTVRPGKCTEEHRAILRHGKNHRLVQVFSHPRFGFSWEGFALEQVIRFLGAERDSYFWATHGGAELDLLVPRGGRHYGFEFKYEDAPRTTKSMRMALADLALDRLYVVYPGMRHFDLDDRITALPLHAVGASLLST